MKRYSIAYRPEEIDGPVTFKNIAKLAARYRRDEYHRRPTDDPPLLVLSHRQYVELRADPEVREYLSWDWGEGRFRMRQIFGFHVITADEEG